jgi:hypothetical protein
MPRGRAIPRPVPLSIAFGPAIAPMDLRGTPAQVAATLRDAVAVLPAA